MKPWRVVLLAAVVSTLVGCALTQKADPIEPRYFSPAAPADTSAPPSRATGDAWLRLHRVRSGSHLKLRAVYRPTPREIAFRETRRWAELPEDYLRRSLSRELFERRGVRRVVSGAAPELEVELTAFDEIGGDAPRVQVAATVILTDLGRVRFEESYVVEKPLPADEDEREDPNVVAQALGEALGALVARVADRVLPDLGRGAAREPSR